MCRGACDRLHVFMPPAHSASEYLELINKVEDTAAALKTPIVIEGYTPPSDPRINRLAVTPDPGVIEVNVQPAHTWTELREIITGMYEDARYPLAEHREIHGRRTPCRDRWR